MVFISRHRKFVLMKNTDIYLLFNGYCSYMSSSQDSGLMSNAGLVRYFDEESENQVFTNPKTIIAVGIMIGLAGVVLNVFL